jgi:hypothetical protein
MVKQAIADLGENIVIKRFARFKVGEISGASSSEGAGTPAPVNA